MLGLQGKGAKPAPRSTFSKSNSGPNSTMATNGNKSRASSTSSDKPEKLASPYSTSLVNSANRRVQSAASFRQRSSLGPGPTIKASELFRKNSEPQIPNKRGPTNFNIKQREDNSAKVNKNKHVRIDTGSSIPSSANSRLLTTVTLQRDRDASASSGLCRRPFSFSSDRSRSLSVASNDSLASTNENELSHPDTLLGAGDAPPGYWQRDFENNNSNGSTSGSDHSNSQIKYVPHPRLSKRSYSIDANALESGAYEDNSQQDFHPQMIEMKIAEHPEEALKEDNDSINRMDSLDSIKQDHLKDDYLNRTFDRGEQDTGMNEKIVSPKSKPVKGSNFDRLLLLHSDNILHDVSQLINEIKSSETRKQETNTLIKVESVERLVDDLRNDITQQMTVSSLDNREGQLHQQLDCIAGRFNCLELSGIELSDITCPQNVMEQSVPNTSRLERPLSAVVLGKMDIISEANKYLVGIKANRQANDNNIEFVSGNSSMPDALSTIQQISARGASASPTVDMDQEEIQRKICSALRMLEEEEQRVANGRSFSRTGTASARSQSPFVSVSNPDSRPESRIESCRSSPRIRSEERKIQNEKNQQSRTKGNYDSMDCLRDRCGRDFNDGSRSARSCSCLADHKSSEALNSARSSKTTIEYPSAYKSSNFDTGRILHSRIPQPGSGGGDMCESRNTKTKQIFSFLDEVEKSDQEMLFGLRFDTDDLGRPKPNSDISTARTSNDLSSGPLPSRRPTKGDEKQFRTLDCLIRKGSVELAREILLLERKFDEAQHAVKLLEESLLNQRELNIRNLRNSEKDFKKRMRMQKEEFDIAFSRNEALINEMVSEKRVLQEKLDKVIKGFEDMEEKYKEQTKSMQQKHLDEIKRLRRMQQNAEQSLKQKLAGSKTQAQEIREMTVKGLEPEVQRIIQRHQQEMSEMRAWHSDEIRETEERYQRKMHMQMEDVREKFNREKEDLITRERELANRRLDAELKQKDDEIESLKRRLAHEIFEERERAVSEEMRLKETLSESMRKAQIKGEIELENLKQEYETKLANLERRHESELKSLKDVYEAEKLNWVANQSKKLDKSLSDQETKLREAFYFDKEREWREKEKKLKEDFEKFRKDDEIAAESRFRRMQEKLQSELDEMEKSERDLKLKFSLSKSDLLAKEEEVFSVRASINMKDKQMIDLQEINMKLQEERVNLTSIIRREFTDQIQSIEEECRSLKASIVEIQSNSKLSQEQKQLEIEKIIAEKDTEIERIGLRVKQALQRKDETILELQKQLEKCSFQMSHLEELLEEQRKEFLHSMKMTGSTGGNCRKK